MVQLINPLAAVTEGQQFVDGLFTQRANRQAGALLAGGNSQGAANTLYQSGDLAGGRQIATQAATDATAARTQRTADSARQLQTTMQVVKALKAQRDAGQDVTAALASYRPTFLAIGTNPQEFDQIAAQVAANPAFLDQVEALTAQAMEYELRAGANGDTVAVGLNPLTGQTSSSVAYSAPREAKRVAVGNDFIEVSEDGTVTPLYQGAKAPEYRSVRNSDGTETIVEVGGRPGGVIGGSGASANSGVPRGIRNNNPGNIEDGPFARSLPGYAGSDGRFAIFNDLSSGEGAQTRLLGSYVQRGFDTPAEIINRWAPPSDNNPTGAYINYVARRAGIGPNDRVTEDKIPLIAQAIREFENGSRSPSNGAAAPATSAGGGARVVAQGENRGLSPAEQRAQATADRAERRQDQAEENSNRRDEVNLRREFNNRQEVKDFRTVQSAYNSVQAAARNPSAAGDLSLIFAYMKILDPGSVVREQEFANAQNAAGVPERIRNLYNRAINGQRLNPNQRNDFLTQANNLFQTRQQTYRGIENEYRGYADSYGVSPDRVAPPQGGQPQRQRSGNTPGVRFDLTPAQQQARQRVIGSGGRPSERLGSTRNPYYINPADVTASFANVPRGGYFITPDGQVRGPKP